jgi:hypothetical protein
MILAAQLRATQEAIAKLAHSLKATLVLAEAEARSRLRRGLGSRRAWWAPASPPIGESDGAHRQVKQEMMALLNKIDASGCDI